MTSSGKTDRRPLGLRRVTVVMTLLLILVLLQPANAADLQAGWDAFQRGDYETALREWLPLAEQGNATLQFNLGIMYQQGLGAPQSDTAAVTWYRKAAEQGDAQAQMNLGFMYVNGAGVPQSHAEAAKWWRKAAEQGNADGQNNMGLMYEKGEGVPQSDTTAVTWYRKAAKQGHANAQRNLDDIVRRQRREAERQEQRRRRKAEEKRLAQTVREQKGEELSQLEQAIQAFKLDKCRVDLLLLCVPVTERREGFLWRLTCRNCEELELRKSDPLVQDNFSSLMMDLLDAQCMNLLNSRDFVIPLYDIMEAEGVCFRPTLDLTK